MAFQTSDDVQAIGSAGIQLTPKLYACRDAAQLHLGEGYEQRMSELGTALLRAAATANCDLLKAAIDAGRCTEGLDAMQLLAAAVELLEPSA